MTLSIFYTTIRAQQTPYLCLVYRRKAGFGLFCQQTTIENIDVDLMQATIVFKWTKIILRFVYLRTIFFHA